MRRSVLSATAICVLFGISAWGQSKHSQVGTWYMDIAQSTFGLEPVPKSITVVILKDTPQLLSWRVDGVDGNGKAFAYSWSGPVDGTMHPVMQNGKEAGKQSAKREDDGAISRHGEDPDGDSFDARDMLSDDGNTILEEGLDKYKDGKETKTKKNQGRVSPGFYKETRRVKSGVVGRMFHFHGKKGTYKVPFFQCDLLNYVQRGDGQRLTIFALFVFFQGQDPVGLLNSA
jgi:hypothetical protein